MFNKEENFTVSHTDRILGNRRYERKKYDNEVVDVIQLKANAGEDVLVKEFQGNKAISSIKVDFDNALSEEDRQRLIKDL